MTQGDELSPEEKIISDYAMRHPDKKGGYGSAEINKELGKHGKRRFSREWISQILDKLGLEKRTRGSAKRRRPKNRPREEPRLTERQRRIKEAAESGIRQAEIARELGVKQPNISHEIKNMRKRGISIRTFRRGRPKNN